MSNQSNDSAVFSVHNEIVDWFSQLVNESCGTSVVQCKSHNGHFTTSTEFEINGEETQLNAAIDFVQNLSEITRYKMPWLNAYTYYVRYQFDKEWIEKQLKAIMQTNHAMTYNCTTFIIIRSRFHLFHFRPDLEEAEKLIIERMFETKAGPSSIFITFPTAGVHHNEAQPTMGTNILTALHGKFFYYLGLEDILSLEMANKTNNSCWDGDLDHDIQKFLLEYFAVYYKKDKASFANLREFRSPDVLRHFIQKCHASLNECFIPNILTESEIREMTDLYNIELAYHEIVHIDFKPANDNEMVNFCAIHHYESNPTTFLDYGPKYATRNYSFNFNKDDSLDSMNARNKFFELILKSENSGSPSKTNALLKYIPENFMVGQFATGLSSLTLHAFELDHVPKHTLHALLSMMCNSQLVFENIKFNLNTLIAILEQSDGNGIELKRCQVNIIDDIEKFTISSKMRYLRFCDMDLSFAIISVLKNINLLDFFACRLLSAQREDMLKLEQTTTNAIQQCPQFIYFESCAFAPCDIVEPWRFSVGQNLGFGSTLIKMQTVFQMLQNCKIQNQILFDNCHFRVENDQFPHFDPTPVQIIFKNTTFDLFTLYTIIGKMHRNSKVWLKNSYISPIDEQANDAMNTIISIEYIEFVQSRLDTQTLLNILGRIPSTAEIHIENCDLLLKSNVMYRNSAINLTNLVFEKMKLNTTSMAAILNILDHNSLAFFDGCEIIDPLNKMENYNSESQIRINFVNMFVDLQMSLFKQKNWTIVLKNCHINFVTAPLPNNFIESVVLFHNMIFESVAHLKLFSNFSETSGIGFINCYFDFTSLHLFPTIVIKPKWVHFQKINFDLEVLINILERVSVETEVMFSECNIQRISEVFSIRPIRIECTYFENMKLDVAVFLRLCKKFTNQSGVEFNNCIMLCTEQLELPNITLDLAAVYFNNMEFDVNLFQIILQKFSKLVNIRVKDCNFLQVPDNMLSNISLDLSYIAFCDVKYSPGFLQVLQNFSDECIVQYEGQLSNRAIIDICTKTRIHGKRLRLVLRQICDESKYFEIFTEYFHSLAKNLDPKREYDLPTYLIPYIKEIEGRELRYRWEELKVKIVADDHMALDLKYFRFGKPIELFYLLNDLPDDSNEEIIDHS